MINIGFIGAGNMGGAIMKGIFSADLLKSESGSLFAFDCDTEKVNALAEYGVNGCETAVELTQKCGCIFLAVKPQQLDEVLEEISSSVIEDKVIVSICAGITADHIRQKTIENAKVVLAMPNTPLLLGVGATALARAENVSDDEFSLVCRIFGSCGEYAVLSQDKMKEIIAINGSSPAFIYLYAQAFVNYAESVGIEKDAAKALFAKSLEGSAKMITQSGKTIEELIEMVSSKGGTTIAGLEKLRDGGLEETVLECCKACTKRAYELSGQS